MTQDGHKAAETIWYPLVASSRLAPGAIFPTALLGEKIVVWRGESGAASVWSDRCPHRGMRLSFGAVQRDTILCPYHGWTFNGSAQCVHVPAHPDLKPARGARVRAFGFSEAHGFIWGSISPETGSTPQSPYSNSNVMTPVRSMRVGTSLNDACRTLPSLLDGTEIGEDGAPAISLSRDPADGVLLPQPMDEGRCMLHLVAPETLDRAARLALSRRLVALRQQLDGVPLADEPKLALTV